jgi:predicted aspartyl protease
MIATAMRVLGRFALALALLLGIGAPAAAEVYRWLDERGNAHYTESIHTIPEAYRAGASPLGMRNAPVSAAEKPAANPGAPSGGALIRYAPGQRILVDVRLNGRTSARLVLDTGADGTLINPRSLIAAGVRMNSPVGRGQGRGVTGSESMLYFQLDSLEIGEARAEKLVVAAHEMGWGDTDGLLGRDFLNRFQVSIDAGRGLVTLTPR